MKRTSVKIQIDTINYKIAWYTFMKNYDAAEAIINLFPDCIDQDYIDKTVEEFEKVDTQS